MKDLSKQQLLDLLKKEVEKGDFNLYRFVAGLA